MPKFYFDCFDGRNFHGDQFGIELADQGEAADHAACLAVNLLGEVTDTVGARAASVVVRETDGKLVYAANCTFGGHYCCE